MQKFNPTKYVVTLVAALALSPWLAPVQAATPEQTTPDMCDDDNRWPSDDDSFELIDSKVPNKRAMLEIMPVVLPDQRSTDSAPSILDGTMRYTWKIYECKDYTGVNSAGFFVYKYGSRFDDDQGIWSMWEEDDLIADTPKRFMYSCDQANCDQSFEAVSRQETLRLAELYANAWPTYESPKGFALLSLASEQKSFSGTYQVSSDMANLMPSQTFSGCSGAPRICVTATAQPSPLGIP